VLAVAGALALLCSIGAAQATVLRRYVENAGHWIGANALGWLAGLPIVFLAFAVAPEHPAVLRAVFAIVGAVGMGATVAAVTGAFLVRLLRRRRVRPPQSLRHRARVHLNHAHAWLYEQSGGRLGRSIAGNPVMLLTTTGRQSGQPRRTPVQYERIGDELFVIAAAGGAAGLATEHRGDRRGHVSDWQREAAGVCAHGRPEAPGERLAGTLSPQPLPGGLAAKVRPRVPRGPAGFQTGESSRH
jgi:F420H(2)-dependent quinone reductase